MIPVPKGMLRVERPASGGGGTTPPVTDKGGGVPRGKGGGTPLTSIMSEAPHPPHRNYFAGPPSPRVMHKWGGVGVIRGDGGYTPGHPHVFLYFLMIRELPKR